MTARRTSKPLTDWERQQRDDARLALAWRCFWTGQCMFLIGCTFAGFGWLRAAKLFAVVGITVAMIAGLVRWVYMVGGWIDRLRGVD